MIQSRLLLFVLSITFLLAACNDPTFVGSDLLDEDSLDIQKTDTITLITETVRQDSLAVWTNGTPDVSTYFVGDFTDPSFGTTFAQLFAEVFTDVTPAEGLFEGATIDSIIMRIDIDRDNSFGELMGDYSYELYRVTEAMEQTTDYTALDKFETEDMPLATTTFDPSLQMDTMTIITYGVVGQGDTTEVGPHLRFDLTSALSDFILNSDDEVFESDSTLREVLQGLNVRPAAATPGLLSLSLQNNSELNHLVVYYTVDDEPREYEFTLTRVGSVRVPNYVQDYSGTPVMAALDNPGSDTLTFLLGLNGVLPHITFPFAEQFPERSQINRATLEIFVDVLNPDGSPVADPPEQLILAEVTEDGDRRTVSDLLAFFVTSGGTTGFSNDVGAGFGGQLISQGDGPPLYRFNLPQHFAFMVRGEVSKTIEISQVSNRARATRLVLYGADHPLYPAKMTVTYTSY